MSRMQLLVLGGMLFSMFFGAGNLILPPLLGLQAGADAVPATAGFLIAGIGLPVLGIIAVALVGDIRQLAGRVHPLFASVFIALVYLTIGPFLAIPRTSTTAYEMIKPLVPGGDSFVLAAGFSVVFFAVAFFLALRPGMLSRILGRFSAPALIVLIALVVGSAIFGGLSDVPAARPPYDGNAASEGFLAGYQTMDLLAALCFGIVVASNVKEQGVTDPKKVTGAISVAGIVAGVLMAAVYCGLSFVGLSMAPAMPDAANGAEILAASAGAHFGTAGTVVVAVIFLLACLNVCIGLISCCGSYFADEFPRVPYRAWAIGFAVFSCAVSNFGLDAILTFSVPLLNALYPMAIVLVLMGMMHKGCDLVPCAWPWAVGLTSVVSVATALRDAFFAGAWLPFDALPFADMGMNWVVPALVGMAIGVAASGWRRGGADAA